MILIGILGLLATGGLIAWAAIKAGKLRDDAMWTRRDDEFMDEDFERHRRAQLLSNGGTIK